MDSDKGKPREKRTHNIFTCIFFLHYPMQGYKLYCGFVSVWRILMFASHPATQEGSWQAIPFAGQDLSTVSATWRGMMERLYTWSYKGRHIKMCWHMNIFSPCSRPHDTSMLLVIAGSNHKRTLFLSTANSKVHKVSSQSFESDGVQILCHCIIWFFSLVLEGRECQVSLTKVSLWKSCCLEMRFPTSENELISVGKIYFAIFYGFQYEIHNFQSVFFGSCYLFMFLHWEGKNREKSLLLLILFFHSNSRNWSS